MAKGGFTAISVKTLAAGENGKIDGKKVDPGCHGLTLWARNDGRNRAYQHRYDFCGESFTISIGSIAKISLDEARKAVKRNQGLLAQGINPKAQPVTAEAKPAGITLRQDTEAYYAKTHRTWDAYHARLWMQSMELHVLKTLGNRETASLTVADVVGVIEPLWVETNETATRVLGRIRSVIKLAIRKAVAERDLKRFVWGNVADGVPDFLQSGVRKPQQNHPAPTWYEAPGLYATLSQRKNRPARALQLLMLLCTPRAAEVVNARWSWIDGDVMHVPACHMKSGKTRDIPLSRAALDLLATLSGDRQSDDFIFPGRTGAWVGKEWHSYCGRMRQDAMQVLLRTTLKLPYHVHGLRSTFRSWVSAHAETVRDHDAAEIALDHVIGNKVQRAYDRSDMMDERRALAERWAAYLINPPTSAKPEQVI